MFSFDAITNKNNAEHISKLLYISDHPYRILITGSSGSRKTNALLNLIREQNSDILTAIDKIYLYAKDLHEPKYHFLGKKGLSGQNKLIEYSKTMDGVYNDIDDGNPKRNLRMLIVFDDMIADIKANKNFNPWLKKEIFIIGRKLTISFVFMRE